MPGVSASRKRIIVTGATGMIGGLIVRLALDHAVVESVTTIGRRVTGISHPRLHEIIHSDFTDFRPVQDQLYGYDVAFFCLGAYTGVVPDAELRSVTVDYVAAFARALVETSPGAAFVLLSGAGADQTEKSRMAFARYKGAAENALLALGFSRVHLFRPGYIYPVTPRVEPNLTYRIMRLLYPLARRVYPNVGVASDDLARVMLHVGLHGAGDHTSPVVENDVIRSQASLQD